MIQKTTSIFIVRIEYCVSTFVIDKIRNNNHARTRRHGQNLVYFIKLILIGAVVVCTQELECSLRSVFHCSADELIDYTTHLVIFVMI